MNAALMTSSIHFKGSTKATMKIYLETKASSIYGACTYSTYLCHKIQTSFLEYVPVNNDMIQDTINVTNDHVTNFMLSMDQRIQCRNQSITLD